MANALAQPHDKLFRRVFSRTEEAAALLRPRLEEDIREAVDWSTLALVEGSHVDANLRRSEPDLLFTVEPVGDPQPTGLYRQHYILLEHQSSPYTPMPFRMLQYCGNVCEDAWRNAPTAKLPKVLALVFYLGRRKWTHSSVAADLFPEPWGPWPKGPLPFAYRVLDETTRPPDLVDAGPLGRVTLPMMRATAYPAHREAELRRAVDLAEPLAEHGGGALGEFMLYLVETRDRMYVDLFVQGALRYAPWLGVYMKTLAQEWLEEGEAKGRVELVDGFLKAGASWEMVERASGLNEAAFRALKEQVASRS